MSQQMKMTQKEFALYEGPLIPHSAKMNMLNIIKISLKQLEKGIVSYNKEGISIGSRSFLYKDLQIFEIADLYAEHGKGNENIKYIRIKGTDHNEYVLISTQLANDRTPFLSGRAVELMKNIDELHSK
jgi:hypothetical protein